MNNNWREQFNVNINQVIADFSLRIIDTDEAGQLVVKYAELMRRQELEKLIDEIPEKIIDVTTFENGEITHTTNLKQQLRERWLN